MRLTLIILIITLTLAGCSFINSPGTYTEIARVYSPNGAKYLLTYRFEQGAWDGSRTSFTTIMNATDSFTQGANKSFSSLDIDSIYWNGNDTIMIAEKFTEFISNNKSNLNDTMINGVVIKVIQTDPIDSSFQRKIFYRSTSPNGQYDLIVYKYVKPVNGNYFLNISVINQGDSIPKFGNFYISKYDFDCFTDIRWDNANELDIKAATSCYYAFEDYLVKNKPAIKYKVQINDTIQGNIQPYMQ
ncbi:MAG: hypothetical protein V4538_12180 [Bacteroidota bacterium]